MEILSTIFYSPEFWTVAALVVAAVLPGPQTRIIGIVFKKIGESLGKKKSA